MKLLSSCELFIFNKSYILIINSDEKGDGGLVAVS